MDGFVIGMYILRSHQVWPELKKGRQILVIFLSGLLLSACLMVGPNYKEPKKQLANHWAAVGTHVKETPYHDTLWWNVFHDPSMTELIHVGYLHNLPLQAAGVQVLQARATLAQAVGELFPQQQTLIAQYAHQRIGGSSLQTVLPTSFDTALLGVSASWEIDFWGQFRRAILANDASFLATYAAYHQTLVNLTADIATSYISIRTTEELIRVTKQNIQVQTEGLNIAKARFSAGESSLLDVEQAQTELSSTQATMPTYVSDLQHEKDALAVLLGTTPDHVDPYLTKNHAIPKAPPSVAVGIPCETLVQRPDIYQSRMQAIAQLEMIGATKANLYPSLSLTGTFALAANTIPPGSLSNIFNWNNRTSTSGPSLNWSVLNYGQITNAVRAQDAVYQGAVLNYQQLVLKAQQEVQDNIAQFVQMKKAESYLLTGNHAAIKSTQLALVRYREGESDYTPVLDSERQQLHVQISLTETQGEIPKALVGLYRALGGGWRIRNHQDVVSEQIKFEMAARTNWGKLLNQSEHEPALTKQQEFKERYIPEW